MKSKAQQWLDGEISMGKMLYDAGVPQDTGSELVGQIWQALHEKVSCLEAALENKAGIARDLAAAAEAGDETRTVLTDKVAEPARAAAFKEAKSLVDFHIMSCLKNTMAAK